mmetsp:Transcript_11647/g.17677  ORF Transcript_11647/g.17677 Transcript_11647/m.17677 type:complete len:153 (+) Transcript_11647:648-1106(+)
MKLVLDAYTEGLVILDSEQSVRFTNPKFRSFYGQVEAEKSASIDYSAPQGFLGWMTNKIKRIQSDDEERPQEPDPWSSLITKAKFSAVDRENNFPISVADIQAMELVDDETIYKVLGSEEVFVKIIRSCVEFEGQPLTILHFVDVSNNILYN